MTESAGVQQSATTKSERKRADRAASLRWRRMAERIGTYLLSLALALVIWLIAINEENPIVTQPFPVAIPIRVLGPDEGLQITKSLDDRMAEITVRAPQNTWNILTAEDFQASIDLNGLGPGAYEEEVRVVALNAGADIVDSQPQVLRVQIDPVITKTMSVQVDIVDTPASGYEAKTPVIEPISVTLSGPETQVNQVASVRTAVELLGAKSQMVYDAQEIFPYDSQDRRVEKVTLSPDTVNVIVSIAERPGRREVAVRPDLTGQPARGYRLASVQVDPSSVVLFGSSDALAQVPGFVETEEISLEGATQDISVSAELILPDGVTASEGGIVQLSAKITPIEGGRTITRQTETRGLGPGLEATVALDEVEVILSGPVSLLESMQPDDMFVFLDLTGLLPGTHNVRPTVILPDGIQVESVLPETVEVIIVATPGTPTPSVGTIPPPGEAPTAQGTPSTTDNSAP